MKTGPGPRSPTAKWLALLPFLLVAAAAGWTVHYATRWGPWMYSDAVGYVVSARNLLTGPGLGLVKPSGQFEPLVSHPPLFPLLIAAGGRLGLDLVQAARWINLLAFSAFIGGVGALIKRLTDSPTTGLAASALLLVTSDVLLANLSAMAEPLFLATGFIGLLLVADALGSGKPWGSVAGSAMIGVSMLARYPAVTFWGTALIGVLALDSRPLRERVKKIGALSVLSFLPTGIFLTLAALNRQAGAARALGPTGAVLSSLVTFLRKTGTVYWRWKPIPPRVVVDLLLPVGFGGWLPPLLAALFTVTLGGLVLIVALKWWKRKRPFGASQFPPALGLLLIFQPVYLGFFGLTYLLTFPTPDIDERTLLPLLIAAELTLVLLAHEIARGPTWRFDRAVPIGLLTTALIGYGLLSLDMVRGMHRTGSGYTARAWQQSEALAVIERLPPGVQLLSNAPEAILLYTDRYPRAYDPSGEPDSTAEPLGVQVRVLKEGGALILITKGMGIGAGGPTSCDQVRIGEVDLVTYYADELAEICFEADQLPPGPPG